METKSNLFWTLMPQGFWNMHLSDLGKPMSALKSSQHIILYPWFCLKELSPKHFRFFFASTFFFCHYYLTLAFLLKGLTAETKASFCGWAKLFEDKAGPAEHLGTVGICPFIILAATVKFIYSEKATKFCEIFTLHLTVCTVVKSKVKISQNFVAFSE